MFENVRFVFDVLDCCCNMLGRFPIVVGVVSPKPLREEHVISDGVSHIDQGVRFVENHRYAWQLDGLACGDMDHRHLADRLVWEQGHAAAHRGLSRAVIKWPGSQACETIALASVHRDFVSFDHG